MKTMNIETRGDAEALFQWVKSECSGSSLLFARKCPWPSSRWQSLGEADLWIKREDELSFTLSGPKFRKFCGLNRLFKNFETIIGIGSARSAFLLGLAQMCREQRKDLVLFLLRSAPYQTFGTDVLYENAFQAFPQQWYDRADWANGKQLAITWAESLGNAVVLPEGGACREALAGALSLALDLVEQMEYLAIPLRNIWIDSGSGFTAQALIWGLGTLLKKPPLVHVVLCAGNSESFGEGLRLREGEARASLAIDWQRADFRLYRPSTAASYGSTNRTVWDKIAACHQDQGILLDPLYMAKLMLTYEAQHKAHNARDGPTLILHSGGGLNNFGYLDGLRCRK